MYRFNSRIKKIESIVIVLSLLFVSCSGEESLIKESDLQQAAPILNDDSDINNGPSYSYLALGDSYTVGTGIAQESAFPYQLKEDLQKKNINISEVTIIAQNGWTTSQLLNAIENQDPVNHDFVSLLIGVNNQFQRLAFDIFKIEFVQLLEKALDASGDKRRVIVISIPDYSVTRLKSSDETTSNEIDMYNTFIEQQCIENGIAYIDITSISRNLAATKGALSSDGLHPSAFQYAKWVELICPFIEDFLKDN